MDPGDPGKLVQLPEPAAEAAEGAAGRRASTGGGEHLGRAGPQGGLGLANKTSFFLDFG